jgi:hypothetical protein
MTGAEGLQLYREIRQPYRPDKSRAHKGEQIDVLPTGYPGRWRLKKEIARSKMAR